MKPTAQTRSVDRAAHFLETTLMPRYAGIRALQPLKVGVYEDIRLKHPRVPAQVVRDALHLHVTSFRYLIVLKRAKVRVDLDGKPAGEVTKEQHHKALEKLRTLDRARKRMTAERNGAAGRGVIAAPLPAVSMKGIGPSVRRSLVVGMSARPAASSA